MRCFYIGFRSADSLARNIVLRKGLAEAGVALEQGIVEAGGFRKFSELRRHLRAAEQYGADLVLFGVSSAVLVLAARLMTRLPIVFNASNGLFEAVVLDRGQHRRFSLGAMKYWCIDYLSLHCADLVFAESRAQARYLVRRYALAGRRIAVVYIGADPAVFHPDGAARAPSAFTAVFRGGLLPATGVMDILEAAELLKDEDIDFAIYGRGPEETRLRERIADRGLTRVRLDARFLDADRMREALLSGHVLLGSFAKHERMERTIQNKVFEALALGMPFVTRDSPSNREVLSDGKDCILIPPHDPTALAQALRSLKKDPELRSALGRAAYRTYQEIGTPARIAQQAKDAIRTAGIAG